MYVFLSWQAGGSWKWPLFVPYADVFDGQTKKRVEELGGQSLSGKNEEGENGWYMYFRDVEGNRFGAYEVRKKVDA